MGHTVRSGMRWIPLNDLGPAAAVDRSDVERVNRFDESWTAGGSSSGRRTKCSPTSWLYPTSALTSVPLGSIAEVRRERCQLVIDDGAQAEWARRDGDHAGPRADVVRTSPLQATELPLRPDAWCRLRHRPAVLTRTSLPGSTDGISLGRPGRGDIYFSRGPVADPVVVSLRPGGREPQLCPHRAASPRVGSYR